LYQEPPCPPHRARHPSSVNGILAFDGKPHAIELTSKGMTAMSRTWLRQHVVEFTKSGQA
jgi:hypothetical protein